MYYRSQIAYLVKYLKQSSASKDTLIPNFPNSAPAFSARSREIFGEGHVFSARREKGRPEAGKYRNLLF
jgi:hypothetical protein